MQIPSISIDFTKTSVPLFSTVFFKYLYHDNSKTRKDILTLFDMGFFEPSVIGGMRAPPHHNFVVIAPMIMKLGTGVKLDVFYTTVTKTFVTSLLLRHYDVITCILADA